MNRLNLDITSDPAELSPVRRKIEAFCQAAGFGEKAVGEAGLVVNEAMANITRHAYGGATDRPVKIKAQFDQGILEIQIRDWGNGYDPTLAPPKQDPMIPGGLGMICLRTLMDSVTFTRQPDGMLLRMRKALPASRQ